MRNVALFVRDPIVATADGADGEAVASGDALALKAEVDREMPRMASGSAPYLGHPAAVSQCAVERLAQCLRDEAKAVNEVRFARSVGPDK